MVFQGAVMVVRQGLLTLPLIFLLMTSAPVRSEPTEEITYPWVEHEGQIQIQVDDGALDPTGSEDTQLFIRRLRPVWKVHFSERLNLDTEFEVSPEEQRVDVLDLLVNYRFSPQTKLSVGRYKVPFGWEGLRSSRTINTIERSDATVALYPERDIGVSLSHSREDLGEFTLGAFLGQPRSNGDANGGVDVIGRAVFPVTESVKVGVSGHLGNFRPTGTNADIPVRRLGGEFHFAEGPFKIESEAIWSDGYNPASQIDSEAFGYFFAAVYRVAEPLDVVLHYDRFDPDLNRVDSLALNDGMNARDRKVIGLNYYISREPVHRVMLNYEIGQSLEGKSYDTSGFRLRYQFAW